MSTSKLPPRFPTSAHINTPPSPYMQRQLQKEANADLSRLAQQEHARFIKKPLGALLTVVADAYIPSMPQARKMSRQAHLANCLRDLHLMNQQAILNRLMADGFPCTQATLSRDLAILGACRTPKGYKVLKDGAF